MKRKLIFVILTAMILSPMTAFAGTVFLDYDRADSTIIVNGSDFAVGEMIAILGSFGNAPPSFLRADHIAQETVKADGTFKKIIPTVEKLYIGDEYSVLVGAASLAAASPVFKTVALKGMSAILQVPLRYTAKVKKTIIIEASYPAQGAEVVCTSTLIADAKTVLDSNGFLIGIELTTKKTGTTMLLVTTPTGESEGVILIVNN